MTRQPIAQWAEFLHRGERWLAPFVGFPGGPHVLGLAFGPDGARAFQAVCESGEDILDADALAAALERHCGLPECVGHRVLALDPATIAAVEAGIRDRLLVVN